MKIESILNAQEITELAKRKIQRRKGNRSPGRMVSCKRDHERVR